MKLWHCARHLVIVNYIINYIIILLSMLTPTAVHSPKVHASLNRQAELVMTTDHR